MGVIGKIRKLNKYCCRNWYDGYLLEYATDISAYINFVAFAANQNLLENSINANKVVETECGILYVNSNNKTFAWYEGIDYTPELMSLLEQGSVYPEDLCDSLDAGIFPDILKRVYIPQKFRIYPFSHITKIEFIDRTTVDENRTYTLESNAGSAMMGAIIGSMFDNTVFDNNAITGAIIGASGARRISEHVDRTVNTAFDIIIYYNDIDNLSQTIRVYNESELREIIAVFEYIMNNRENSEEKVQKIELNENIFDIKDMPTFSLPDEPVNKWIYILLAIFLGNLGVHHFYAKKYKKGFLYLLFSWSFIPWILAFIDAVTALTKPIDDFGGI